MHPLSIALVAILACAVAQEYTPEGSEGYEEIYPDSYKYARLVRPKRFDWGSFGVDRSGGSWSRPVGGGDAFGRIGANDMGAYGKLGYSRNLYDGEHGTLTGSAYGSRTIGAYGQQNVMGGRLDFGAKEGKAFVDVSRPQHSNRHNVEFGGTWEPNKNTRGTLAGTAQIGGGKPDVGVMANIEHKFPG